MNAHGTSTPIGDTLEAHAIRNFFGEHKVPVSSTKSMTGHLLGGAGGLEAGMTVLALRDQILPPTINLENPDPETGDMDFVPNQARKANLEYAMSNSFGFGGTNGALFFRAGVSRGATFDSHGVSETRRNNLQHCCSSEIGVARTRPSQRTRRSGAPWTIEFSTHPYSTAFSFELLAGSTQFVIPPVLRQNE